MRRGHKGSYLRSQNSPVRLRAARSVYAIEATGELRPKKQKASGKTFLEADGIQGGLSATEVGVPDYANYTQPCDGIEWIKDVISTEGALTCNDVNTLMHGQADCDRVKHLVMRTKRRKYTPRWSAPGEILTMTLCPEYVGRPGIISRVGIGLGTYKTGVNFAEKPDPTAPWPCNKIRRGLGYEEEEGELEQMDEGNFSDVIKP